MQDGDRGYHRDERVDIAHYGDLLTAHILERAEIKAIRDAGVDESDRQKQEKSAHLQGSEVKSARERDVGDQHDRCRRKLQERAQNSVDLPDIFVDQHDGCVKASRAEPEKHADRARAARADTRDKKHAERREYKAEQLFCPHFLLEEKEREQSDEHGREIIGERRA